MQDKIRWGFLGTGWIAEKMATAFTAVPGAELAAVGSRTQGQAELFARSHGVGKAYGSYEALAADPDIDAVYVATPHPWHCDNTLLCLRHGKAVLCEKPLAMNELEVRRMIAAAREHRVFLMEAFWTRFLPSIDKVLTLIADGALGELRYIHADFGVSRAYDPAHRAFNKALGGGSLLDIGIYPVFLVLLLWGEPDRIEALPNVCATGVDETLALTFHYNDGRIASLFSSFRVDSTVETQLCGTAGRLQLQRWWYCPGPVQLFRGEDHVETFRFPEPGNGYNHEIEEVDRCLRAGKTESALLPLDFSLRLVRLLDRIRSQIGLRYDADERAGA